MKSYDLFLHWKQGDDFGHHLEKTETVTDALNQWAESFEHNRDICRQIATALKGKSVHVDAGTHMILFTPEDAAAESALEALVKEDLISVWDDGLCEDDED